MFRLYQFLLVIPIILFFAGCGGSATVKKDRTKTGSSSRTIALVNSVDSSSMSNQEKISYAERLFNSSLSKKGTDRNTPLSNALYLCSEVLLSEQLTVRDKEHALQSTQKIMSQLDRAALNDEQSNQLLLTTASVELANYQSTQALQLLNQEFNSALADQWSLYHKLRAMSYFQQGYKVDAIKELIFRHAFILADKLENQTLMWKYLSTLSPQQLDHSDISSAIGLSENERLYFGWLDLADIFRHTNDPQNINYATSFWLQNYPDHQADRSFINHIIRIRQESIINISHIAVLLPMDGKLAKPAKAIQDGIAASHYKSPLADNVRLRFYNTSGNKMIEDVYQYAINNGADFVIGPLKKSNLQTLLESNIISTPILALNSIETSSSSGQQAGALSQQLFQFGLSPEAEARIVAHKARQDGHRYAAIIAPDSHWGKRMSDAFAQFWQQSGGTVVEAQTYPSQEHDFSAAIKAILNLEQSEARKNQLSQTIGRKLEFTPRRRQDIDMLFMAAFPRQAKQIPLQIIYHHGETIPVYATSHIIGNYYDSRKNIDMDGVIFSDMPFLLGLAPDAASLQNSYQTPLYQRLFAMGVDSYQVAPYVNYLADNPSESVSGDTGQLSINFDGHIIRSLPWASFSQGKVKLEQKQQDMNSRTGSNDHATLH